MIEGGQNSSAALKRRPQAPWFLQLIRDRAGQGIDESAHDLLALTRMGSPGGDRVLVELPIHQRGSMIVGGEDRVEMMLLFVGE